MHAMPGPFAGGQPLAEHDHRRDERDHRDREHVERRRSGRQDSAGRRSTAGSRARSRRAPTMDQQQRRTARSTARGAKSEQPRQQRQRQHADQHLPGEEVEQVERGSVRWKYFVATVPAAQPNPDSTAHSLARGRPPSATARRPAPGRRTRSATASHWPPRTRSCSTGQASSSVQNGIVNTSTDVRPAPPPASAIVVEPKLTVVWKKPVTTTATHDVGHSEPPLPAPSPRTATRPRATCAGR